MSRIMRTAMAQRRLKNGMVVLMDDDDQQRFDQYAWQWDGRYIFRLIDRSMKVYFHAEVMGGPFLIVDHKNQKALDCRKANLRLATHAQNMHNRGPRRDSPTGHKGVAVKRGKRRTTFEGYIYHGKRRVGLGTYVVAVCTAMAHDYAARLLRGEWAPPLFESIPPGIQRAVTTRLRRRGLIA